METDEKDETPSEDWIVEVIEYTDPYCTWCWGSEPILRKIKEVYGSQVKILFKMGGLVEDIREFYDLLNLVGGERWYEQAAAHWEEASSRHGMPVDSSIFYEIKDSFTSTYPANIAVKAAELQDKELAKMYLRRLREAVAAERGHIHKLEVQAELAREVGLDPNKLLSDISSGKAEKEFFKDLKETKSMGITGFPTFLIRNLKTGRSSLVTGYRRYKYFEDVIDEFTGNSLKKRIIRRDKQETLSFVKKWKKVATQEVATLLDTDKLEAYDILTTLVEEGFVDKRRAGNDYFWLFRTTSICSVESEVCMKL